LDPALVKVIKNPFDISAGPLERSGFGRTLMIIQIHNVAQVPAPIILIVVLSGGLR
jgi:hypothetical protein